MLQQSASYLTSRLQQQLLLLHFIYVGASDWLIVVELTRLNYCHFCLIHLGVEVTVERIRDNRTHIVIGLVEMRASCLELGGCPVHGSLLQMFYTVF
jgi:hypothetical protein